MARSMLLNSIYKWPDHVTLDLWPFAVSMAADTYNNTPRRDNNGLTPNEAFSGVKDTDTKGRLKAFHTFGCPVFVLEKNLQDGNKIPRWDPRSRQGIYLGHSSYHASSVALVMNLHTMNVSCQYHVVFDDEFTTVDLQ